MNIVLFIVFALLQCADVATTLYVLKRGGREANPVMAAIMARLGNVAGLVVPKLVILAVVYRYALPSSSSFALLVACALYAAVIVNNANVIRAMR